MRLEGSGLACSRGGREVFAGLDFSIQGGEVLLVTQNIDDLHERAGSRNLVHMHGELLKTRCAHCHALDARAEDLVGDRVADDGEHVAEPEIPGELMEALRAHDLEKLALTVQNDLEAPALRLRPELAEVLTAGVDASALGSLLSGSGPTCLFLCDSKRHAGRVVGALRDAGIGPVSFARGPVPGARVERVG